MRKELVDDLRKIAGNALPAGRRGLLALCMEAADALEKTDREKTELRAALEEFVEKEKPLLDAARAVLEKIDG